jgi:PilZ domain-containing protein
MPRSKNPKVERRAKKRSRKNIQLALDHESEIKTVSTHDISGSGLSCYLPTPLTLFTKYKFRLLVPMGEGGDEEIDGEGIVVRVEEVELAGENFFQTALFFQHLDDGHRRVLEDFILRGDGQYE